MAQEGFYVKGNTHCDWGMKNRLSRMFDPKSGNTVMLAFDHGYIMGPTAGLERIDLVIPPLIPYVDVLMGTRGVIHSCISPTAQVGKCVRVTYDSTVLFDDMSNGSGFACDIDSVIRLNADCMAVQTFIGAAGESRSLELLAPEDEEKAGPGEGDSGEARRLSGAGAGRKRPKRPKRPPIR